MLTKDRYVYGESSGEYKTEEELDLRDKLKKLEGKLSPQFGYSSDNYTSDSYTWKGNYTWDTDTDNTYRIDPNAIKEMGVASEQAAKIFDEALKVYQQNLKRKFISSINIDVDMTYINVTKIGDPTPQTVRGADIITITDQDGERVPEELHQTLEAAYINDELTSVRLREVLDEWNGVERTTVEAGHKSHCLYLGTHEYPCTCQPPTIWGEVRYYHCDCCEEARALVHHGLCGLCEAHQNDPSHHAESEHEVRAMSE